MYTQEEQQQIIDDMSASIYNKERTYTEDELGKDAVWIEASKAVYKKLRGSDFVGTDEELAKEGFNIMSEFNHDMTFGTAGQTLTMDDADDYTKTAFYYMIDTYDKKDISKEGVKRALWQMGSDPLNWAMVIGTAGVGFFGKQAAGSAAKAALKEGLKQSAIRYMSNPVAVGAVEGAAYTVVDDAARQDAAVGAGFQEGYDPVQGAIAGTVGAGVGAGLVKGTDVAVKGIGKGINKVIESGEEEMMKAAGGGTPPVVDEKDLIIQHNLSERNLAYADTKGGISVPSLAITNKGTPLEGFGEITMLGDEALATPSKETKVFGADIYSPRHPKEIVEYKPSDIRAMDRELTDYQARMDNRYGGINTNEDIADLENNIALKLKFIEDNQGSLDLPMKDGKLDYYRARDRINEKIEGNEAAFKGYVEDFKSGYEGKSSFYSNYKKKPYTEENIIKHLTKNLRGGEGFNYGGGSVRAMVTPEFKTIKQIKAAKEKLISSEDFTAIKDNINNELLELATEISPRFGEGTGVVTEYVTKGKSALQGYDVKPSTVRKLEEFKAKLKEMPTEYFEAKVLKKMDLGEFKYAVIPENASDKTKQILEKKGIEYSTYNPTLSGDRVKQIQKIAEEKGYLFALPAALGLSETSEQKETNDDTK